MDKDTRKHHPHQVKWMPREKWDALIRGDGCFLCKILTETGDENDLGFKVADLEVSRLFLCRNQWVPGYSILVYKNHVREPFELSVSARQAFFEDMMNAGHASQGKRLLKSGEYKERAATIRNNLEF